MLRILEDHLAEWVGNISGKLSENILDVTIENISVTCCGHILNVLEMCLLVRLGEN